MASNSADCVRGVARLTPLAGLRSLDLSRTQVSSRGLNSLRLPELERLSLWRAKRVDDTAAEALAGMGKLRVLDLAETGFGDEGLRRLGQNKSLRKLFLRGSGVTSAGVKVFRAENPECEVSWE